MKKIIFLIIVMFSIFSQSNAEYSQLATSFEFNGIDGDIINTFDNNKLWLLQVLLNLRII